MFSSIRYKQFLFIFAANMLLGLSIYGITSWSIGNSFLAFVNDAEAERFDPMLNALAWVYEQEGSWDWVHRDKGRWESLTERYAMPVLPAYAEGPRLRPDLSAPESVIPSRFRQPPSHQHFPTPSSPPPIAQQAPPPGSGFNPFAISAILFLADAEKHKVLGPPEKEQTVYWMPITLSGETVGYLGFSRLMELSGDLDTLFSRRLHEVFVWVFPGMVLISLLIALPSAARIVKPIERLKAAVHQLAGGSYQLSMPVKGRDELATLARDLNQLAHTLGENELMRRRWLMDISHELRTPVALLQAELEAILDNIHPLNMTGQEALHQHTLRLSHLIRDLHELSMAEQGALRYDMEPLDPVELVQDVIDGSAAVLADKGVQVVVEPPGQAFEVMGDYQRLSQVIDNFLQNSVHYTDEGGQIRVHWQCCGEQLQLSWLDSSPGVSDEDLPRLFDRLYRADASRSRHTGGSGLGLAICHSIVTAHGGRLTAEHSPLGGVCLNLSLPLTTSVGQPDNQNNLITEIQ